MSELLFDTFISDRNTMYPNVVQFINLLEDQHDHFQSGIQCLLKFHDQIIFSPKKSFYIKHHDAHYYIPVDNHGLTMLNCAIAVMKCLIISNDSNYAYEYNINNYSFDLNKKYDCVDDTAVHKITKTTDKYMNLPVYVITCSS